MSTVKRWLPIRKLAVAGLGYGLTWGALRLGLDLGSDAANQAAAGVVAGAFGYAERDPRVSHVLDDIEGVLESTSVPETATISDVRSVPCAAPNCSKAGVPNGE